PAVTTGLAPVQAPAALVSACAHASPASPAGAVLAWLHPVGALELSAVQRLPSSQERAGPPTQVPVLQVSAVVQALPSSHAEPSTLFGLEQVPVAASQVPAVWHWSLAVQTTGFEPTQAPAWQVSVWEQALSSLQA